MIAIASMSREQTQRLAGRVLRLPETRRHPPVRVKIIRVVVEAADPRQVTIHGIHIDASGREAEGRTVVLTPDQIAAYLE